MNKCKLDGSEGPTRSSVHFTLYTLFSQISFFYSHPPILHSHVSLCLFPGRQAVYMGQWPLVRWHCKPRYLTPSDHIIPSHDMRISDFHQKPPLMECIETGSMRCLPECQRGTFLFDFLTQKELRTPLAT